MDDMDSSAGITVENHVIQPKTFLRILKPSALAKFYLLLLSAKGMR